MTPEQTLDWLAQQHFDQCCEERPIQDWIRKMKSQLPEQPKQNTLESVKAVLKGIDQTEIESPDGWWETSAGAEFGAKKLKYIVGLLAQPELCKYGQEPKSCTSSPMDCQCALDATFEQIEQEPVAILQCQPKHGPVLWHDVTEEESNTERFHPEFFNFRIVYTTPPQRTWVGLTIDEMHQLNDALNLNGRFPIIAAIEAKLKEKNA